MVGIWGRLEADLDSGLLHKSQWGYGWHWSLPFVEQGYSSLVGERDTEEHGFSMNRLWQDAKAVGLDKLPAEKIVEVMTRKMIPYDDDPLMWDFNWQEADGSNMARALATGIYSEHKAKFIAWHRHYTRFWMESVIYCDHLFPVYFNPGTPDFSSVSHEAEIRFLNEVTGKNITFAQSMETGRKIWNLNRAIWTLQGRHRNMENFAGFMYTPEGNLTEVMKRMRSMSLPQESEGKHSSDSGMTVYKDGKWEMADQTDMYLDKAGMEHWKTNYYNVEGWDPETGWPKRRTLEELGLKKVADTLEKAGRLGAD